MVLPSFFRIQSFDRVADDCHFAAAIEQTFDGEAHAVFGDYTEDKDFRVSGKRSTSDRAWRLSKMSRVCL